MFAVMEYNHFKPAAGVPIGRRNHDPYLEYGRNVKYRVYFFDDPFLTSSCGRILKMSTCDFLQIVEEEWSFFFYMQYVVIYTYFS